MISDPPSSPGLSSKVGRTFRDPAGWVEVHPADVFRFVQPEAQPDLLEFLQSPLAAQLVRSGKLVRTDVLSQAMVRERGLADPLNEGLLVLRHPRIAFLSYPWEWCPAQWFAAARLTLDLNRDLLSEGWILKDATPLNVLFQGSQPIFVDVASVARVDLTKPIWYAYSQFIRTFLLPMLAHSSLGWPLRATSLRRDGYEPEEIFDALPTSERVRQPALSAVTLPSLLGKARKKQASEAANKPGALPTTRDPELVLHILQQTTAKLLKQMRRAVPRPRASTWTAYAGAATHYSEADHVAKRAFVAHALKIAGPRYALDVGANAGVYSELAVEAGATQVVAIDTDLQTLDRLYGRLQGAAKPILPLVIDLANPTPGAGWLNKESASFLKRATGHFDTVIMLAVLHHLLLHDHIPMQAIAEFASALTTRTLIVEWVPPGDSMFRELVRGREAIFASVTEAAFRHHFEVGFRTVAEKTLDNGRILFHLEKHSEGGAIR